MCEENEVKQLVILGNGFDLACGLRTSYWNFINYVLTQKGSDIQNVERLLGYMIADVNSSQGTTASETLFEFNPWYLLLIHSKISNQGNWQDVEAQMYNYFQGNFIRAIAGNSEHDYSVLSNIDNRINQFSKIIVKQFREKFDIDNFSEENIAKVLAEKLHEVEKDFENFLFQGAGYTNQNAWRVADNSRRLLQSIISDTEDEGYNVITFNYTDYFAKRWDSAPGVFCPENYKYPQKYNMVHGQAVDGASGVNHIIFGIDNQDINTKDLVYRFTKTYRTLLLYSDKRKLTDIVEKNVFDKSVKAIKFYGHSLGEADYSYFQQMFDYYDLYHNDELKLYFYFSKYGNKSSDILLQEQVAAIIKLIEKYGTTMDNENHGKNLLTRLQQTKRIFVREIPVNF